MKVIIILAHLEIMSGQRQRDRRSPSRRDDHTDDGFANKNGYRADSTPSSTWKNSRSSVRRAIPCKSATKVRTSQDRLRQPSAEKQREHSGVNLIESRNETFTTVYKLKSKSSPMPRAHPCGGGLRRGRDVQQGKKT